jgi:transposase
MFFRVKKSGGRGYLQIVENRRVAGSVRQSVIANLGRAEALIASGALAGLVASGARLTDQVLLLQALEADDGSLALNAKRIGGPLLFGRLWQELGIGEVLAGLLAGRGFGFAVERAVFVATLHRLFVSGSDRDCASWMADYALPDGAALALHHFYRAMAWLGEAVEETPGSPAPRCVKDQIEERLFERRRDLFTDLSVAFMDTTSLAFEGEGGESLGEYGYSKDFRPELRQMILALVMDGAGWPVCTEMWPGNTADVMVLLPIVDRLRRRFGIGRVCIVADRGMISAETIAGLEARGLDYILGAREHTDKLVRQIVLDDAAAFVPLAISRRPGETQLFVKEVKQAGRRYIVCRNEAEAENDRTTRQAIVAALDARLRRGDKTLIGNAGYRRYLRKTARRGEPAFEIDPGKLAEAARFDGIFVLRTNARLTPLQAVLRYRDLVRVEDLFRRAKAVLRTRPIFHSCDAAIRGHVFCSFLALLLQKRLDDLAQSAGVSLEWKTLLCDLDQLQQLRLRHRDKDWLVRTDAAPALAAVFQHAKIALPPRVKPLAPPATPPPKPVAKRRGRPRRSATATRISPETPLDQ